MDEALWGIGFIDAVIKNCLICDGSCFGMICGFELVGVHYV